MDGVPVHVILVFNIYLNFVKINVLVFLNYVVTVDPVVWLFHVKDIKKTHDGIFGVEI